MRTTPSHRDANANCLDEPDNAALAMMERLGEWDHDQFKKVIVKVANMEIAYKAVSFYLARQPNLLPDLLAALTPRLDHGRVVKILQREDHLPLAKPYLIATQKLNLTVVNEAYNDLLIEEEDHVTLRSSLETYDQYDAIKLAKRLETHELLEFRRIAALLYRVSTSLGWIVLADSQLNHMYEESLGLSKADRLWRDCLETAASSKDTAVAEELAGYFVSIGNKDGFAAALFVCFELVRPDFVEEMVGGVSDCCASLADASVMAIRVVRLFQAIRPAEPERSRGEDRGTREGVERAQVQVDQHRRGAKHSDGLWPG